MLRSRRWVFGGGRYSIKPQLPQPIHPLGIGLQKPVSNLVLQTQGIQPSQCLGGVDHWVVTAKQYLVTTVVPHELNKLLGVSVGGIGRGINKYVRVLRCNRNGLICLGVTDMATHNHQIREFQRNLIEIDGPANF